MEITVVPMQEPVVFVGDICRSSSHQRPLCCCISGQGYCQAAPRRARTHHRFSGKRCPAAEPTVKAPRQRIGSESDSQSTDMDDTRNTQAAGGAGLVLCPAAADRASGSRRDWPDLPGASAPDRWVGRVMSQLVNRVVLKLTSAGFEDSGKGWRRCSQTDDGWVNVADPFRAEEDGGRLAGSRHPVEESTGTEDRGSSFDVNAVALDYACCCDPWERKVPPQRDHWQFVAPAFELPLAPSRHKGSPSFSAFLEYLPTAAGGSNPRHQARHEADQAHFVTARQDF